MKVAGAGVCGSDLHIVDSEFEHFVNKPVTLGHEVVGFVGAIGPDVTDLPLGEGVAVMVGWGCGHCEWCVSGYEQLCPDGDEAGATRAGASPISCPCHIAGTSSRSANSTHSPRAP